jgi:N-acetyl-anhydromuramyl-L-alanine amidase AmpD
MKALFDQYPFIQAKNFTRAGRAGATLIVIHTMESEEKPGTARGVAEWFAGHRGDAPPASAHFCVGPDEVLQCVRIDDVAWHAPGANSVGIGIEHAGRAAQTALMWDDAASRSVLALSAKLCAALLCEAKISPARLTPEQVRSGESGICGHIDVTRAFPDRGHGHTDPGPNFPWDHYIAMVSAELASDVSGVVSLVEGPS